MMPEQERSAGALPFLFGVPRMATADAGAAADIGALRDKVLAYLATTKQKQAWLARQLDESASTLCQVLNADARVPAAKTAQILKDASRYIDDEAIANAVQRPRGFIDTAVAKTVIQTVDLVRKSGKIGVLCAPAGVGKTSTIQVVASEARKQVVYICIDNDSKSASGLLKALVAALRIDASKFPGRMAAIKSELHGTRRLVVFDQAHLMRVHALHLVPQLWDACGSPFLLVGNDELLTKIDDTKDVNRGQIRSRFGLVVNLVDEMTGVNGGGSDRREWFSLAEVRKLVGSQFKLSPAAARIAYRYANDRVGHLRSLHHVLDFAALFANKTQGEDAGLITETMMLSALSMHEARPMRRYCDEATVEEARATA